MATLGAVRTPAEVGRSVKATREREGMTQAALAAASGVPLRSLQNLEQGRYRRLELDTFARLAGALGLGLDELYQGAPPAASPGP
jgi:transcriptional regulator with XRE-family HTH domain